MKRALMVLALAGAAVSLSATGVLADPPSHQDGHHDNDRHDNDRHDNGRHEGKQGGKHDNGRRPGNNGHARYDSRGRYVTPPRIARRSDMWRGKDGRYYCRRDNGTTGLVIGAGLGAIAGNQVAGRGDKTVGTIVGGVLGGLIGREIDKGSLQCR
ncbi:glycine zipper 2TM domain-containing protein [Novosphingobium sp. 1949]|uniref:17 kDa surface antigen n=1 Tax=Novosphingobium organovorum TaxID=2930092 RepID=A0ABT0BH73_9SPHN|nr:glycine zipper 2TM domain-containing protein [Novosphingobium organovorum]MCJ2184422.1 glycine zipper 2TM domain-containing protein [Novosphingobium organovorum]